MKKKAFPQRQGLYDPGFEHDSCGVGFVCDIHGRGSQEIVRQGLEVLRRLAHRGATGADPQTGDGAGILIQMPHDFFRQKAAGAGIELPGPGTYASGLVFLPIRESERRFCQAAFAQVIKEEGVSLLGWRKVPVDDSSLGNTAKETQPAIEQVFIASGSKAGRRKKEKDNGLAFERKLYLIRKRLEKIVRDSRLKDKASFYITNLSSRTFSYKGLLKPDQLEGYFLDLKEPGLQSAICLVHSRYSTNTFPTWDLAQPFRFLAHNGEINTLRGNINWMRAREGLLENGAWGKNIKKILPVIVPGGSDSAALDNLFELLFLSGRPLQQAMMMLIPAAWQENPFLDDKIKAFYKFHACLMEPWDGPAAVAFTDGKNVGAVLDRNGLRPARYLVTKQGLVVMASEVGVLDIPPEEIAKSGRLEPGKMFFIDTVAGKIVDDAKIKSEMAAALPYEKWVKAGILNFDTLSSRALRKHSERLTTNDKRLNNDVTTLLKTFGYTREDLRAVLKPMAEAGQEPVGSMGNDTPPALLSRRPQLLFNYFKQLFAQVTNPAIDPIREGLIMSLHTYLGPERNMLKASRQHCRKILLKTPILTDEQLRLVSGIRKNGFRSKRISLLFPAGDKHNFLRAIDMVCREAEAAIKEKYTFVILSDRGVDDKHAALPSLLAVAGLHHYLVRKGLRTRLSIILESAEPRAVQHFALLFGYGADCVNPYLAYQAVEKLVADGGAGVSADAALHNYVKAVEKGVLKILSKMGISTLQSYRGAQIFEALGLDTDFVERYFSGTPSRIGGAGLETICTETLLRHQQAFGSREEGQGILDSGGVYQWKKDGEFHLWNPESIAALQDAVRNNDENKYREFSRRINEQAANPVTLRSLIKFKKGNPVPLEEVEPVEEIIRRFATGAMSFGSISRSVHEAIAIAMNRLGGRSNTGEGGEDPARFSPLPNGDSCRSAIKQVASGRFGVTTNYLVNADELQIKIAQGAKPGEGGQLPGHKVSEAIARTRYTTPGVTLISPPPHHDIYSIEDLAQLIFDLQNVNPRARVSVKLVSEAGVGTVAAGVAKGHADMILISGGDGGTGASPLSSIMHAGLPWELGLAEAHQTLVLNNLRSRLRLQTDGQMRTGRDVAVAALLGAEEFGFATAVLIVLGCVMLRHCSLNNCSVGIATQDEVLEKRFTGKPEYLVNYFRFVAEELRQAMAELGFRKVDEMVGRSDMLELNRQILPWKAGGADFSRIFYQPPAESRAAVYCTEKQHHGRGGALDRRLIDQAWPALQKGEAVKISAQIKNSDRAAGAMLSGELCRRFGEQGLSDDSIRCNFRGFAGESFAAWLVKGVTFELEGMANDYVGKGISGGKIIIYPDKRSDYPAQDNVIIGNTAFYGAINGQAYIRGIAGERFCIRNSGLSAVVEGVGDHGCEYMTGGRVVILGETGRNFAAGMSGGIAYVYDEKGSFRKKCNLEMVGLESPGEEDARVIHDLLRNHHQYTGSPVAGALLQDFAGSLRNFIKVVPMEYKRILEKGSGGPAAQLQEVLDG